MSDPILTTGATLLASAVAAFGTGVAAYRAGVQAGRRSMDVTIAATLHARALAARDALRALPFGTSATLRAEDALDALLRAIPTHVVDP